MNGYQVTVQTRQERLELLRSHQIDGMLGELDALDALLHSAFPHDFELTCNWSVDETSDIGTQHVFVAMTEKFERVSVVFGVTGPATHPKTLNGGYLFLHPDYQKNSIGSDLAFRVFSYAREFGIELVVTTANLDKGSHSWARLGARPYLPDTVKVQLLERIERLVDLKHWNDREATELSEYIRNTTDPYFMFGIANFETIKNGQRRRLGKELLTGDLIGNWSWQAYWRLDDPVQRQIIELARKSR